MNVYDLCASPRLIDSFAPFASLHQYVGGVADRLYATQADGGSALGVRTVAMNGVVTGTFATFARNLRIAVSPAKRLP